MSVDIQHIKSIISRIDEARKRPSYDFCCDDWVVGAAFAEPMAAASSELAYAMDNLWRIINETGDLDDLKRECSEALCVASRRLSECSSHVDGAVAMAVNGGYEADADYLRGELSAAMGIIEECSEMVDQLTF